MQKTDVIFSKVVWTLSRKFSRNQNFMKFCQKREKIRFNVTHQRKDKWWLVKTWQGKRMLILADPNPDQHPQHCVKEKKGALLGRHDGR
jgi:hypothetical protein